MKERLDVMLVQRNLAESREKAKAIIMCGNVFVNGQREDKAGSMFPSDVEIEVKGHAMKYVSRGGYKLEKAIEQYGVSVQDKVCMDVGSSTGGFTDCMLQNGASKVYAVDVGTNQLAWSLRQDERVVSMEKTNIRYVTKEEIGEPIAFASIDVAFISLTKVLIPVRNLLEEKGQVVCLIKPQFEAGREKVGKKGVVREKSVHIEVIEKVIKYAVAIGFDILNLDYSPIKGPEGNIEYLLYLEKKPETENTETNAEEEDSSDEREEGERYMELSLEECNQSVRNEAILDLTMYIRETVANAHGAL
ncbi:TlyA family RNA methyltransferase [Anaerosporobacter faecicola]|uniref:TlyA family RNA methyltransferase n=1 Tax=Anaerosporobacter faecicola TaxID=2718714 RepID=UPI00143C4369|nr:TlyA family RNA methyltransferase [Anaerosporobacter faecicola]